MSGGLPLARRLEAGETRPAASAMVGISDSGLRERRGAGQWIQAEEGSTASLTICRLARAVELRSGHDGLAHTQVTSAAFPCLRPPRWVAPSTLSSHLDSVPGSTGNEQIRLEQISGEC